MSHKNLRERFRAIEVATTSLALWWGVTLLLPSHIFKTGNAYQAMADLASEQQWAIFMLLLGAFQLTGMLKDSLIIKKVSLLMATGVWFFVATMFAIGNFAATEPPSFWNLFTTAGGAYAIFGSLTAWLYTKVGGQYGR